MYSSQLYRRFVKEVQWLDENGKIFTVDKYNKQGYCFAKNVYDLQGKPTSTTYLTEDNKEVLVENHKTGDLILNQDNNILVFKNQTEFVSYYLRISGFDTSRILYNSLATPFFVAHQMGHTKGDILFWQENVRPDIPYNMELLLEISQTKIVVQNWASYEKIKEILPDEERLSYLGYLYPKRRQNLLRPNILILTNSDNIEQLTRLVEQLPRFNFHIGAITEMSSKLLAYSKYDNVKLYPNISDEKLELLKQKCDIYLDINHGSEIFTATRSAFEQAMLILCFKETQHQSKYIAEQNSYWINEVDQMIQHLEKIYENPTAFKESLDEQYKALKLGNKNSYKQIIE